MIDLLREETGLNYEELLVCLYTYIDDLEQVIEEEEDYIESDVYEIDIETGINYLKFLNLNLKLHKNLAEYIEIKINRR